MIKAGLVSDMKSLFKIHILPPIGYFVIKLLRMSMRLRTIGGDKPREVWDSGSHLIIAFWHGRQLMTPYCYKGKKWPYILISEHGDGEIISRVMGHFGFCSIRGSTTRGGIKALREMIRVGLAGNDLTITPDGPKGPKRKAQMGVITLAKKTGLPIFPVSFGASKVKKLGSWDSFLIPYPFSKGVLVWGEPVFVKDTGDADHLKQKRQEVEDELNRVTDISDTW